MRLFSTFRSFSALRGFVIASAVGVALLSGAHVASAQTAVYDAITGAASYTFYNLAPRTAFGQVFTLGTDGGSAPKYVTGTDFALVSGAATTYNFVHVTQYFWATPSYAVSGTTAAYSNLLGARTYTLTNQTFAAANTVRIYSGGPTSFGTPAIALTGVTGNTIGFSQVISTSTDNVTYTLNDNLTTAFTVGTPAAGTSAFNSSATATNFYYNALSESNGNFAGSDARNTGALSYMAARIYGSAAPEPGSLSLLGMGLVSGAGVVARRRRKAAVKA